MRGRNEGYGINSGVARSGKVLRRILKLSDASSTITDAVVAAACATDAERLVKLICDERLRFLQSLRTWPVFGIGWGRRVADVRSVALKLAADGRTTSSTGALMAGH
jgi:lysozyme family protein